MHPKGPWFNETFAVIYFLVCNIPILIRSMQGGIPAREMIVLWWITPFAIWVLLVIVKIKLLEIY